MTRVLVRASKTPFDVFAQGPVQKSDLKAAYRSMNRDGTKNVGNLVFAHSVYKVLSNGSNQLGIDDYQLSLSDDFDATAERINAEYDVFAIPLCNSFRKNYRATLQRMTKNLKKLTIPTVVVGVGAQLSLDLDVKELDSIKEDAYAFASAILDKSQSIGVRGEVTKKYLVSIGLPADRIDVIGCPSVFYNGENLHIEKSGELDKIAINLSAIGGAAAEEFAGYFNKNWRGVSYIPQVRALMPYMAANRSIDSKAMYTIENSIPKLLNTKHTYFINDVSAWLQFMREQSFAIGTRIHGNIVPIIAGTPSHVIVHDSRTLELADYFGLPHTILNSIKDFDVRDFYEKSDYTALNDGHKGRIATYATFLEKNGLSHALFDNAKLSAHDKAVEEALAAGPRAAASTAKIGSFAENFDGKFRFPWQ